MGLTHTHVAEYAFAPQVTPDAARNAVSSTVSAFEEGQRFRLVTVDRHHLFQRPGAEHSINNAYPNASEDPSLPLITATFTTKKMSFVDDIAVTFRREVVSPSRYVASAPSGPQEVTIARAFSCSRVGKSDLGQNKKHINEIFSTLSNQHAELGCTAIRLAA
eukprot:TRINITY_DN59019_c0_g1_i1.p1 TRINITY_DN59019_c0_g1~~TRINITY_DN59019_c0_g1_i1.p1  ORF type:complete len:184 (-),score=0.34 TRINITY_DN59019_c0_g1_i1:283-768(-)